MPEITISWKWLGRVLDVRFGEEELRGPGVYLWTLPHNGARRLQYIGISEWLFDRHSFWMSNLLRVSEGLPGDTWVPQSVPYWRDDGKLTPKYPKCTTENAREVSQKAKRLLEEFELLVWKAGKEDAGVRLIRRIEAAIIKFYTDANRPYEIVNKNNGSSPLDQDLNIAFRFPNGRSIEHWPMRITGTVAQDHS